MEQDSLKKELRTQLYKEVEEYIGYVEADDFNLNDKLVIKQFDYSLSHGCFYQKDYQTGYDYFSMSSLIKQKEPFVFEVNPIGIEVILQKYFPDKRVNAIKNDIVDAINKYIKSGKDCLKAKIVFKFESIRWQSSYTTIGLFSSTSPMRRASRISQVVVKWCGMRN